MTPEDFKAWRNALGFSQDEAARHLGISRGSVQLYERGRRHEDGRPVEIPLTVQWACDAVALDQAIKRRDLGILSPALQSRVRALAELVLLGGNDG